MTKLQKGYELFDSYNVKVGEEVKTIEFTFRSLIELERRKGSIKDVYGMFENDLSSEDLVLALYVCLLKHHKAEFKFANDNDMYEEMMDYIDYNNLFQLKIDLPKTFFNFWLKAKESESLPAEYKALFKEMEQEQAKKK